MSRRSLRKTSDTKKRVPNGWLLLLATATFSLTLYFNVVHATDTGFSSTYAYYTVEKRFGISDAHQRSGHLTLGA